MARPSFTPAEQYLISHVLEGTSGQLGFELSYLLPAAALVLFGFIYSAPPAFAAAFAIVVAFRWWQLASDRRSAPAFREIIRKYEQACNPSGTDGAL